MESWIDESKLKIFKPRLEKSMLGIGVSPTPAPVRMLGLQERQSLHDICRLRN